MKDKIRLAVIALLLFLVSFFVASPVIPAWRPSGLLVDSVLVILVPLLTGIICYAFRKSGYFRVSFYMPLIVVVFLISVNFFISWEHWDFEGAIYRLHVLLKSWILWFYFASLFIAQFIGAGVAKKRAS